MLGYASRDAVLKILMDEETTPAFLKDLFPRYTRELSSLDKGLVREICLGVIRNRTLLDFNIDRLTPKKPSGLLRAILRLTGYQIFFMKVPNFAAVNVGVELAKQYEGSPQAGFVNVVLKKMASEGLQKESGDSFGSLSVNFSHPEWLVKRWHKRLGRKGLMQALERNNQEAPLWLRVNPEKAQKFLSLVSNQAGLGETAVESVQAELLKLKVNTERDGFAPLFLKIVNDEIEKVESDDAVPVAPAIRGGKTTLQSELFKAGVLAFQDPAAWLISELADWRPTESVLDMCAAPGGKAACMVERASYLGLKKSESAPIVCSDISFRRLRLLADAKDRMGHQKLLPLVMEISKSALRKTFDLVVVDAPCSNLGVLRRRPEARWTHIPGDLMRLARIQRELLEQAAEHCSERGRIIYATCSPEEEETASVIDAFLKDHKNWCLVDAGDSLPTWAIKRKYLWLHPGESEYDGFFAARLEKVKLGGEIS